MFAWAMSREHIDRNPADERIDAALPPPGAHRPQHHAALPAEQVGPALRAVDALPETGEAVKACLKFIALTACRSGEGRGASWQEIDLQARTWTLAPERTKTGREHRVPLSDAAMDTLAAARGLGDGSGLVFRRQSPAGRLTPKPYGTRFNRRESERPFTVSEAHSEIGERKAASDSTRSKSH